MQRQCDGYIQQQLVAPPTYLVNVTANPENSGTATGSGVYNEGETCVIEITPNVGFSFLNLTENGSVVTKDERYSFQVFENHNFSANFTLNQYEITAAANPEDAASISGSGTYDYGSTCTMNAIPNQHWHFENWTANGEVVSTEMVTL